MSDIISAKCFGCGHVVKVPGALGGKKARCPKCTNTIAIPSLLETQDDIVSDDQLPEVAKDGDPITDDDDVLEEDPEAQPQTASSAARRVQGARRPGARETGSGGRSGSRMAPPRLVARRSSNAGLIVGVLLALAAVVGIAVAFSMKSDDARHRGAGKAGTTPEKTSPAAAPRTAEDAELESRARDFLSAWNKAQIAQAAAFYDTNPSAETKKKVGQMIEGGVQYKNPEIRSVSAAAGTVTFVCEYQSSTEAATAREVTLKWRKDGDTWYIAEGP